jgi:hypothetical protein
MSNNGTGSNGRASSTIMEQLRGGASPFDEQRRTQLVDDPPDRSDAVPGSAAAALGRIEQEIDQLWRVSMTAEDDALSERLAEVSHALRRAACAVGRNRTIG